MAVQERQQWEYLIAQSNGSSRVSVPGQNYSDVPMDEAFLEFGNHGWELVSTTALPHGMRFIFKRPKLR